MFRPLKYSKYERPEGYSKNDPIVYVRKNVIRDIGMPEVNYAGLHELFHKDLGVPTSRKPKAKLYGGSIGKRAFRAFCGPTTSPDNILGFHTAYTNTIHVNASATERRDITMRTFAHEAQHLADSRNFPLARGIEIAAGAAFVKTGIEVADATFVPELIGALAARSVWYGIQPAEQRARATERSEIALNHINDIVFPRNQ